MTDMNELFCLMTMISLLPISFKILKRAITFNSFEFKDLNMWKVGFSHQENR